MNVNEALEKLKKHGITDSIQQLRKWLRDGRIEGEKYRNDQRQEGWTISNEALEKFIRQERPLYFEKLKEIEDLKQQMNLDKSTIKALKTEKRRLEKELEKQKVRFEKKIAKLEEKINGDIVKK